MVLIDVTIRGLDGCIVWIEKVSWCCLMVQLPDGYSFNTNLILNLSVHGQCSFTCLKMHQSIVRFATSAGSCWLGLLVGSRCWPERMRGPRQLSLFKWLTVERVHSTVALQVGLRLALKRFPAKLTCEGKNRHSRTSEDVAEFGGPALRFPWLKSSPPIFSACCILRISTFSIFRNSLIDSCYLGLLP